MAVLGPKLARNVLIPGTTALHDDGPEGLTVSEQPPDLKSFLKVLWRRRWLVGTLALAGLAGGIAHELLMPPLPQARALVIVPSTSVTTSSGSQVDNTPTQIIIATSTPVLAPAGAAVSPPESPTALKGAVSVTALSADVLQFQVTAHTASKAEKLANALASAYVSYVDKTGSLSNSGALPALQRQASRLARQVQNLQRQINSATAKLSVAGASTSAGQRDSSLISSLGTEQEEVSLQLNSVNNEIVSTQLSGSLSASATRVLQGAAIVPASTTELTLYPLVGVASGLFAGSLFVFFRSRRDRRLRSRDEFARAVGGPVLASFDCVGCKTAKDWRRLLERYEPSPVDSWNVRRLLHGLPMAEEAKVLVLNVLAFADDAPALAAGVKLARSAAGLGVQVTFAPGEHESLALLRATCTVACAAGPSSGPFILEPRPGGPELSTVRLTLSVNAVDQLKPEVTNRPGSNVLAVSAGRVTAEALARVALGAGDAGHRFDGIMVVNPDPADTTVGIFPVPGEARLVLHHSGQRPSVDGSIGQIR